ncbi:ABC transporter ATP-binding protein [Pseudogemmobacter humi]|uniref:High-affinity branched-chain amino acid transport ATP-binding protein LivF n=1 Tax=Pseudogemmobacter humi TaxID=2483812 RepID=A0A3P5XC27_9RHOB|nr:ABC transporter ATP-binding protein [Pseudogemmobacter humi]VDC25044.1 High-affinity branched-chain amino acid transport ATP-binding protein LivF [Pseudogemmobacter humi]
MLIFDKVSAGYGQSPVLFGLDLDLPSGSVSTLLGKNGMGKTTTVRTIFGLTSRITGDIVLNGRRINGLPAHQIARMGVALVPEGRQVFPTLTVVENLVATSRDVTAKARAAAVQQIFELFPRLEERKRSYANLLSGGEQQMLAIGRALMTRPRFLILDEATEGLAPVIRREIWAALKRLKEEHYTILVIDKSLKPLCKLGDRHNIIRKGECVWTGDSEGLAQPEGEAMRLLGV